MLFSADQNHASDQPDSGKWQDSILRKLSADLTHALPVNLSKEIKAKTRQDLKAAIENLRAVSADECRLYLDAYNFVKLELNNLGINAPTCIGPISFESNHPSVNEDCFRGVAFPNIRSFHINLPQSPDWMTVAGVAVHEITHLSGKVTLGRKGCLQSGFLIGDEGRQRFHLLEEFTCLSMQSRYWRQHNFVEMNKMTTTSWSFDGIQKDNYKFIALLSDVYLETDLCKFIDWSRISLAEAISQTGEIANQDDFEYNFESIYWSNGEDNLYSSYAEAFKAVIDLSKEVYPLWQDFGARLTVENMMLQFHSNGNIKAACDLFRADGRDSIIPLLAHIDPNLNLKNAKNVSDLILLKAYVDAFKLEESKRDYLRANIAELIKKPNQLSLKLKHTDI